MIDVLYDDGIAPLLSDDKIIEAVQTSVAAARITGQISLCLRFAANNAVQQLNAEWRNKDSVTDVLSFSMQSMEDWDGVSSLGDMILAAPFVEKEAKRLQLPVADHVRHLIVHGTLHLLGFDHIEDDDAEVMQKLENKIMLKLGLHMPYVEVGK